MGKDESNEKVRGKNKARQVGRRYNPDLNKTKNKRKHGVPFLPYFDKKSTAVVVIISVLLMVSIFSFASFAVERNVTLKINVFTQKNIEVVIQPPAKTALPGTKVTYSAMIKNPNPVRLDIGLIARVPPGWSAEISDSMTINAKSSKSITFKVASSNESAIGSYPIELRAEAITESYAIEGRGRASYNVDTHSEADVSITPQTQTGLPGKTLQYNVHIRNNDAPGFDPSTFVVTTILPKNWTGQLKKDSQEKTSISVKLASGEEADIIYEVVSPSSARAGVAVGVNVTTNKLSTEGYAFYDVTLCGDGICNEAEDASSCALDCGIESRFSCRNNRCNEQADDGVKFEASTDFQFSSFLICKYGSSVTQCENSKNSCGIGKPCLCSSSSGISATGKCNLRCVDNDGEFYIFARGISDSARSMYNYSFECPYVDLAQIKRMRDSFASGLSSYEQAKSALTETINRNPLDKFGLQPCADAYALIVSRMSSFVSFLNGVVSSPAISNATEARARAASITADIESSITTYCAAGATGLLDITSISQPGPTEIRNNAQGSASVRNAGGVPYYGRVQCDFTSGTTRISVNNSCTRFNPGASITFKPSAAINSSGTWKMQCRTYGSLSPNCTPESLHDTSEQVQFDAFSKDVYVTDVRGACSASVINCTVRTNNVKDCARCYIGNVECTKTEQTDNAISFVCPYVPGTFTLKGSVFGSPECTPVNPAEKSIETRCPVCGDGIVDANRGEQCEPPNTDNNPYAVQESGLICNGRLSAVRDAFGFCTSQCKKSPDPLDYACKAGICGAECSDGQTRKATVQKTNGVCSYVQQCGSACVFNTGNCEAPDLSVMHSPQSPQTNDITDITATTTNPGNFTIEVFVDNISRKTCTSSPCSFVSVYAEGEHAYRATIISPNGTSSDPSAGAKKFRVSLATIASVGIPQPPLNNTPPQNIVVVNNIAFAVAHSPQNPAASQAVTISTDTNAAAVDKIEIFVDNEMRQVCMQSPCTYSSAYSVGPHSYYAVLASGSRIIRVPATGASSFNVVAPSCVVAITNLNCAYNATKRRYIVNTAATWNSFLTDHAHIDIEGDFSEKLAAHSITFSREQAGPGLKTVRAAVHNMNDSTVCQDQKQVLCDGGDTTEGTGISIIRSIPDTVNLGISKMRLSVINDKDTNDFQLSENIPASLNISSMKLLGNSSEFAMSYPVRGEESNSYTIRGRLKGNENISLAYDVDFAHEGSYEFYSRAAYSGQARTETKTVYATACMQTNAVSAERNGECRQFSTSCAVPAGWNIVSNCPSTYKAQEEPIDLISIIAVVIIVAIIVIAYVYRDRIREKFERMSEKKIMKSISGQ